MHHYFIAHCILIPLVAAHDRGTGKTNTAGY